MKKDLQNCLPCDKFIVKKLLSHGSYGIVYLAYSHIQHQTVAVKVEKTPRNYNLTSSNLQREIYNLQQLDNIQGVPQVLDFDCENSPYSYFSMPMLGKDFSHLLKKCNNMFSHKTVLMIASQVVSILCQIHERGFIHRDIKPENLVLGIGQNRNKVYMIDFGTAKSFLDKATKNHIQFQEKQPFVGTYRYAAKAPHFGQEQGRKDDLESLGYVLIYLCKGRLPWQDQREYNQGVCTQQKTIGQMKQDISINDLCEGLPSFFLWYLHFVNALKFDEKPNYQLIIEKIHNCMSEELKCSNDNEFDWSAFSMNQSHVCLSNQDMISMYSSINNYNSINNNQNQLNVQGLQSSNILNSGNLITTQNHNNLLLPQQDKISNGNTNNPGFQKGFINHIQKLKTFNKSKSVGVQNTDIQSFEENYSRQVHCEVFPNDNSEEDQDSTNEKYLPKHIPYLFQSKIRHKQLSQQINNSNMNMNDLNNNNSCSNNIDLVINEELQLKNDYYKPIQKQNNDYIEDQLNDITYKTRSLQKKDTNDHINNTNRMLQNISINIPTSIRFTTNIKKQFINEPIQEDNLTQENTQTIDSFLSNQDDVSNLNLKINVTSINTSKQPKFMTQKQCSKELNNPEKIEIGQNTLKLQLS